MDAEHVSQQPNPRLYFGQRGVSFYDGCNSGSFGNSNGRSAYVAAKDGTFIFSFQDWDEENTMTVVSTAKACTLIDEETGEEHFVDLDVIIPDDKIGAYELSGDELRLYYPEHTYDVLVFKTFTFPPTSTPIHIPEATLTAEVNMIATMNTFLTRPPTVTPVPPTPYPGQTIVPSPTISAYPFPN